MTAERLLNTWGQGYEGSLYVLPEEGGESATTAINFKDSLTELNEFPPQIIDFDGVVASALERGTKTVTQTCVEILQDEVRAAPHSYLYTHDAETAKRLEHLSQMLVSRTNIGETSSHKVFFASLSSPDDSPNDRVRVAVKPFTKEPEKAITDWSNTMLARKRGLDTFMPLGFIIDNGVGYVITERQDDIDPLDNVDWTRVLMAPERYKNMLEDLRHVGPALARLHADATFHGDPQMKNVVLSQEGKLHWIDWESATFINRRQRHSTEEASRLLQRKTEHDLKVLFSSLARPLDRQGVGLLHAKTPAAQYHYFNELILTPYLEERIKLLGNDQSDNAQHVFTELEGAEAAIKEYITSGVLYHTLNRTRHSPA